MVPKPVSGHNALSCAKSKGFRILPSMDNLVAMNVSYSHSVNVCLIIHIHERQDIWEIDEWIFGWMNTSMNKKK